MMQTSIADLHGIYGQLPPYLQLTAPGVRMVLEGYDQAWTLHYPEEKEQLEWQVIERREDGFWAIFFRKGTTCFITAIQPLTGIDLYESLEWLFEKIRSKGIAKIVFGGIRDPFGLGWNGLPPVFGQLATVLSSSFDYQIHEEWIVFELKGLQSMDCVSFPQQHPDYRFEYLAKPDPGEWEIIAFHGQKQIGECEAWNIPIGFEPYLSNEAWRTIEWIGVETPFRRQGLGKALLLRQLAWQKGAGIDKLVLWTERDNEPIQALVRWLGFENLGSFVTLYPKGQ